MKKHDWTAAGKARAKSFRAEILKLHPEQNDWIGDVSVTWESTGYGRAKVPIYTIRHSDKHTATGFSAAECIEKFVVQRVLERLTYVAPPKDLMNFGALTAQQKQMWSQGLWQQSRKLGFVSKFLEQYKQELTGKTPTTVIIDDLLAPRPTVDAP